MVKFINIPSHVINLLHTKYSQGWKLKLQNVLPNNIQAAELKKKSAMCLVHSCPNMTCNFQNIYSDSKTSNVISDVVWRKFLSAHRRKHIFVWTFLLLNQRVCSLETIFCAEWTSGSSKCAKFFVTRYITNWYDERLEWKNRNISLASFTVEKPLGGSLNIIEDP